MLVQPAQTPTIWSNAAPLQQVIRERNMNRRRFRALAAPAGGKGNDSPPPRPPGLRSPGIDEGVFLPGPLRYRRKPLEALGDPAPRLRRVDHPVDAAADRGVDRLGRFLGPRGAA